jgi:hypothetical protein
LFGDNINTLMLHRDSEIISVPSEHVRTLLEKAQIYLVHAVLVTPRIRYVNSTNHIVLSTPALSIYISAINDQ